MFDCTDVTAPLDPEIARYDVSEDGVIWRPYDPARDHGKTMHTRIVFAEPHDE